MSKIITFIKHPITAVKSKLSDINRNKISKYLNPENFEKISDKKAIKARYFINFGKYPDLKHPKTYNEKLQWLKLYDRNPLYTKLVDKAEVKKIVADKIGEEYIVPTYGVWDRPEQIEWEKLPNRFVIKCTHDSGSTIVCGNKDLFDKNKVSERLKYCLSKSQFYYGREWPYKNVKPRIIVEQLLGDSDVAINDYKILCCNGEPKIIMLHQGRRIHHTKDYYDANWNHLNIKQRSYAMSGMIMPKPKQLSKMLELSRVLSSGFPEIRVDWYLIDDKIYFGELTFFEGSGFLVFDDPRDDELIGSWIKLPDKRRKKDIANRRKEHLKKNG